ncbi:NAD-dependent epimerase/dehydratase family protein [Granulicella arctica]|uniref:NAD-dependent epimerase/dehydratase family protein n=1 Tax=Granulicella arctica TaxID=940613 RepID=UPI0021DF6CA0|nr:NAD-dependent epimerase/dehydratase family protein [Granulicella arctica]
MSIGIVTGSAGLIGSEACKHFAAKGMDIIGIDNDMRSVFFGEEASTSRMSDALKATLQNYRHCPTDIRDRESIFRIFREHGEEIKLVIHTAAQPSHDWAARDPFTDFGVNALGTLTMLEATRQYCPNAVFIFTSTNKVYGDSPNRLPLVEHETRWEIDPKHPYAIGIDEQMSIDNTMHSVFGASKVAADIMVQEYGRYFDMKTACFRGGCLTGPAHSGTQLHGFLAYLMKCCVTRTSYNIFGYKGKQVRDNIHSYDLIQAFDAFFSAPRSGEIYNIGGGRFSNCSMLEAIEICEQISGTTMSTSYKEGNRMGDHMWWVGDLSKFQSHYPNWRLTYNIADILRESYEYNSARWLQEIREGVAA